jgi:ABC-type transport system involved in cytochrome bd biosynthesis fused ATPase/permease subunit
MPLPQKNKKIMLELRGILFSMIEFLVYFFRKYLRFRVWVLLIPLLIVALMGKIATPEGLFIGLIFLVYLLLLYLDRWFENHEGR